VQTCLMCPVLR